MSFIIWIIFGGLVGWIASLLMGTDARQGAIANVFIGIIGAFIGGFISRTMGGSGIAAFDLRSFGLALLGAVILLAIVRLFSPRPIR